MNRQTYTQKALLMYEVRFVAASDSFSEQADINR